MHNKRAEEKRETPRTEAKYHSPSFLKKAARMASKRKGKKRSGKSRR